MLACSMVDGATDQGVRVTFVEGVRRKNRGRGCIGVGWGGGLGWEGNGESVGGRAEEEVQCPEEKEAEEAKEGLWRHRGL